MRKISVPLDSNQTEVNPNNPELRDSSTQTVIRVYPFVFENVTHFADVKSDKKIQTALSVRHDLESNRFYSMLRYTPFQDIKEDCLRVLDMPRMTKLKFLSFPVPDNYEAKAKEFSLEDDDGVGYICNELLHRFDAKLTKSYVDAEVQTDVKVAPHILTGTTVATVCTDASCQTLLCCRRRSI